MFTQQDLAKLINLHRTSINRIERGHAAPRMRTLRRFATLEFRHGQHLPMHWL
jgi:DNA-binding XRE family transcriptional regulator